MPRYKWSRIRTYVRKKEGPFYAEGFFPYIWGWHLLDAPESGCRALPEDLTGIPIQFRWSSEDDKQPIPHRIVEQLLGLRGQVLHGPIFLEHEGVRCVMAGILLSTHRRNNPYPSERNVPLEGEVFEETPETLQGLRAIILVPADVIDFVD